jgi:hypothetical protein
MAEMHFHTSSAMYKNDYVCRLHMTIGRLTQPHKLTHFVGLACLPGQGYCVQVYYKV